MPPPQATLAIDRVLHHAGSRSGTFGPTGQRLFTERMDDGLGILGQYCYVHHAKIMDPLRLAFRANDEATPTPPQIDWYPSHVRRVTRVGALRIDEHKFITDDDCFVDVIDLTNESAERLSITVGIASEFARELTDVGPPNARRRVLVGAEVYHGEPAAGALVASGLSLEVESRSGKGSRPIPRGHVEMNPRKTHRLVFALGIATMRSEAIARANRWVAVRRPVEAHCAQYVRWFRDNCPTFECDDAYVNACWWYRWFLARHCLSRARTGNLEYPCFFEGMHEKGFPSLIAFSSPHILAEVRWLHDPVYAFGQTANHCRTANRDGYFWSARVNWTGSFYTNWIDLATWEAFLVHPETAWLRKLLPGMARDVRGVLAAFDADGDRLPAPPSHWATGMEWSPAFFYFNGFDNAKPDASIERGDFVAYVYGNARAVAAASRRLGRNEQAAQFDRLADEIRSACLGKMWDDADGFFYGVRSEDDARAPVREIAGFYPFMSRLVPDEPRYMRALAYLVDEEEFWNPWPLTTVTKKCPVYSPHISTWPGPGGKTSGCMWNGPTWPHANAILLNVMAAAILDYRQDAIGPRHFWRLFDRYTHLHFHNDDLREPMLHEYYDGQTAQWEGCPDYFHSTYNDLVIQYIAGLQPRDSADVVLRPIAGPLTFFVLDHVRYRGHALRITYRAAEDASRPEVAKGYTLFVDGRRVAHRSDLGELTARNVVSAP